MRVVDLFDRGRVSLFEGCSEIFDVQLLTTCSYWFCNQLQTLCFSDKYDDDVCVSLFISNVLFLFSPYTHFSCLYNLSIFYTWCLDGSYLVFQLRQIASLSYINLSSCKVFQELIRLDRFMYFMCQSIGKIVKLIFSHNCCCGFVMNCQRGRLLEPYLLCIGISFDKMHLTYNWEI